MNGAALQLLVQVRSQAAEELLGYLRRLEVDLARNPLLDRFRLQLNDLRVPLRVVPHEPIKDLDQLRAREHFRQTGGATQDEEGEATGYQPGTRISAFRTEPQEREWEQGTQPESLAELEPKLRMVVLLGDPGSGKTEWLKDRARHATREALAGLESGRLAPHKLTFPILLRLREMADNLRLEADLRDLLIQAGCRPTCSAVLSDAERAAAAILRALVKHHRLPVRQAPLVWKRLLHQPLVARGHVPGACLLCLDAWDEVRRTEHEMTDLAQCLNALAEVTSARILLTSRIVGYSRLPLLVQANPDRLRRELRLCPLEIQEVEQFATDFFQHDAARGQRLVSELRTKEALAAMAQNPLLATLVCSAFSSTSGGDPPGLSPRRVEVYDRVLHGLLGEWPSVDKDSPPQPGMIEAKLKLLEALAEQFFPDEVLSGDKLHSFLWDEDHGHLTKLPGSHPLHNLHGNTVQEELCRDGVLVPCAKPGDYLFLHPTFQEYLVARALARRANTQGWPAIAPLLSQKAWLPEWQETIILVAGMLADPAPLLEMLANPDPTQTNPLGDDRFRHRLGLAGQSLSEVSTSFTADHVELLDHITTGIVSLWWEHQGSPVVAHLENAFPALAHVNAHMDGTPLLSWLCNRLADGNHETRRVGMKALGRFGGLAATREILDQLAEWLADPREDNWYEAAYAVGKLGRQAARQQILDALRHVLSLSEDHYHHAREAAALALRNLGNGAATWEAQAQLAPSSCDPGVDLRGKAVPAVVVPGSGVVTAEIRPETTQLLGNPDQDGPNETAGVEEQLDGAASTPELLEQLVESLRHPDKDKRLEAACWVAKLGSAAATPEIMNGLADLLRDSDAHVRFTVAYSVLERLGSAAARPEFLARLAELLKHPHEGVRSAAVRAIRSLGSAAATPEFQTRLAQLLSDPDEEVCCAAVRAVGRLGSAELAPAILARLLQLLYDPDERLRCQTVRAVGKLGRAGATPDFLDRLAQLLKDPDGQVRHAAARAAGRLCRAAGTPEILAWATQLLKDSNVEVRRAAVEAVGEFGPEAAQPEISICLTRLLSDPDKETQCAAAVAVGKLGIGAATPEILVRVKEMLSDSHIGVRHAGAMAVKGLAAEGATPAILTWLGELLDSPDRDVRSAAAQAGGRMMALGVRFFKSLHGQDAEQAVVIGLVARGLLTIIV